MATDPTKPVTTTPTVDSVITSSKTTIMGILLGILFYASQNGIHIPTTKQEALNLVIALAFAGFGAVAKDFNVSGPKK